MYFPKDTNFQYFFFSTYPGYFLQVLPFALIVGAVYYAIRFRRGRQVKTSIKAFGTLFVCYLTGLICLTLLLDYIGILWYLLIYRSDPGRFIYPLSWNYNFIPLLPARLDGEMIMNIVVYLPFGVLLPLSSEKRSLVKTVAAGLGCILAVELIQPIVGRAFDINDIILNMIGVIVSSALFFASARLLTKKTEKN